MTEIVDTNVILVANRQHQDVSNDCILACMTRLEQIMKGGRIAIDDGFHVLNEYQNKTSPQVGKRAGDLFVKWALQNHANPSRCDRVPLVEHPIRGFDSFPDDPRLANFDPPDRKFVAVSAAHSDRPPIAQATDSKWLGWEMALHHHGISVVFICPKDINRFNTGKKNRKSKSKP